MRYIKFNKDNKPDACFLDISYKLALLNLEPLLENKGDLKKICALYDLYQSSTNPEYKITYKSSLQILKDLSFIETAENNKALYSLRPVFRNLLSEDENSHHILANFDQELVLCIGKQAEGHPDL